MGINIKPQKADLNTERIKKLIDKITEFDDFKEAKWLLDEPIINFSQSVVDDTIKENVYFLSKAGFQEKNYKKSDYNKVVDIYEKSDNKV